jgi:hypothetical protein
MHVSKLKIIELFILTPFFSDIYLIEKNLLKEFFLKTEMLNDLIKKK